MQTSLVEQLRQTPDGKEAESILRTCVHCGFCLATCPTYQLLGDELDSPRGRIYLMKQVFEGQEPTRRTQLHLDRCLTCRACETTCPSGVRYGRLVDIGRAEVETRVERPWGEKLLRQALRRVVPYPRRFGTLLGLGRVASPVLPARLKSKLPPKKKARPRANTANLTRRMLVLDGCVQPATAPNTNAAAQRVLARLGIDLISAPGAGCCGAVSYHLNAHEEGLDFMRRNIDAWWPYLEQGVEAIVMTASGCGALVRDYGDLLKHDADYAEKAARLSSMTRDLGEILSGEDVASLGKAENPPRVAYHPPCTLQHGQQLHGGIEGVLRAVGFELTPVPDSHLCCGSAGTYSILQSTLAQQLLRNKLTALEGGEPDVIVTANIGCQMHLESAAGVPVRHWIELIDEAFVPD